MANDTYPLHDHDVVFHRRHSLQPYHRLLALYVSFAKEALKTPHLDNPDEASMRYFQIEVRFV